MSTQILFQPFVWRDWTSSEIFQAWLLLARDRLTVAMVTALTLLLALRWNRSPAPRRLAALFAASIVVGATLGESLLALIDGKLPDPFSVTVRVTQWCVLAACVGVIYDLWQRSALTREQARVGRLRQLETTLQLDKARLQALRSQIEPHFLFNTLATVRRLHQTEPSSGTQLLAHFINYLNLALPRLQNEAATLGCEVELVRAYLGIATVRFSGRLQARLDVPADLLACPMPPLTLATLVENAVKHGIAPASEGGSIDVQARRIGDAVEVSVTDTGAGFTGKKSGGIGLDNVRARLDALYGSAGTLTLRPVDPHGVQATIQLPWREGQSEMSPQSRKADLATGETADRTTDVLTGVREAPQRGDRTTDARFPWRRAFVFGLLWAVARTASEALALQFTRVEWLAFIDVNASMLVVWTPVGLIIVFAAYSLERRFTRTSSIAVVLLPLAGLLAVLMNGVWWVLQQLGHGPPAAVPIAMALIGVDGFVYDLWMVLAYGGLLAALCILVTRFERARGLLLQTEIERRQAQLLLGEAEFDALRQQVDPAFVRRALAEVQRRYAGEPASADRLLDLLVGFLRCAMPGVRRAQSTLADELEVVRTYVRLRQALDPHPHGWRIDAVAPEPEIVFPPLLLMSILDRLATSPTLDGGWFELRLSRNAGVVLLTMDGPNRHEPDWLPEDALFRLRLALRTTCGDAWSLVVADPTNLDRPAVALCRGEWPADGTHDSARIRTRAAQPGRSAMREVGPPDRCGSARTVPEAPPARAPRDAARLADAARAEA